MRFFVSQKDIVYVVHRRAYPISSFQIWLPFSGKTALTQLLLPQSKVTASRQLSCIVAVHIDTMGWNPFWDRFSISIYLLFSTRYSAWNIFVAYRGYSITKYVHGWTIFYPFDQLQLPTSTWIFFTLNVDENTYFLTNYPPHLVHLVCDTQAQTSF